MSLRFGDRWSRCSCLGRPSLPAERAADRPLEDAYWNKQRQFPDYDPGYPWWWAPSP
jgi:hypothetical protein